MGCLSSVLPAVGGLIGSVVPGVGTAVGGALGGAFGAAVGGGNPSAPVQVPGTTTTTGVPSWLLPYLQQGTQGAQDVYNTGYQVAPLSSNQQTAADVAANFGSIGFPRISQDQQTLESQFVNPSYQTSTPGNSTYAQFASGANLNSNPGAQDLAGVASGSLIGNNPYIQQVAQNANDQTVRAYNQAVTPAIDSSFETAGRYGSGLYANARSQAEQNLGIGLANSNASLYNQDYQQQQANQLAAANSLGGLYNTAQTQQLAGAEGLGQNYNNAANTELGAAQQARGDNAQVSANIGQQIAQLLSTGANQQTTQQAQNNSQLTNVQNYLNNLIAAGGSQNTTSSSTAAPSLLSTLGTSLGNSGSIQDLLKQLTGSSGNTASNANYGVNYSPYSDGGATYGSN